MEKAKKTEILARASYENKALKAQQKEAQHLLDPHSTWSIHVDPKDAKKVPEKSNTMVNHTIPSLGIGEIHGKVVWQQPFASEQPFVAPGQEVEEDDPHVFEWMHWPIFTILQVVTALALWIAGIVHTKKSFFTALGGLESWWYERTDLIVQDDCVSYRHEIWRWWSYQYSHIGFPHILTNSVLIFALGTSLEGHHGCFRLCFMFQIGVFGGACCYFLVDSLTTRVVGMSGGCYALLGMQFGDILMNCRQTKYVKAKIMFLCVMIVVDVLQAYLQALFTEKDSVSHSAHIGGFITGFLVCILVGVNKVVEKCEKCWKVSALIIAIILVVFCLGWMIGNWPPKSLLGDSVGWCWARQVANRTLFDDSEWYCVRCGDQACINRWISTQTHIAPVSVRDCGSRGGFKFTGLGGF